jgi:hypothetical protein
MNVLQRDQRALVGRDVYTGDTGQNFSPVTSPSRTGIIITLSGGYSQTRTRRPSPELSLGPGIVWNLPTG